MSNQQWNNGQGGEWGAQQQNPDWGQPAQQDWGQPQPQTSAQDWNQAQPQASAQDWNQAQPQASAQDRNQAQPQASAQDWNQQGAPQQGWGQPQQDWNQQAAPQQDWNQQAQPQWQGQPAPGYFPGQVPAPAPKDPSPFDFSWAKLSLPTSAKLIFMLGVIALGVEWLFGLIAAVAYGGGAVTILVQGIFVGLAGVLVKVLALRVLIEIGVSATKLLALRESEAAKAAEAAAAVEPEAPTAS